MTPQDLMAGPPPTLLPEDEAALAALDSGESPEQVAAAHPTYSLAWALLAVGAALRPAPPEAHAQEPGAEIATAAL